MQEVYRGFVCEGQIEEDAAQLEVAAMLDDLLDTMQHLATPSLLDRLRKKRYHGTQGLYIHSGVGRGKSMLMDIFFTLAPLETKRRVHFHAFMSEMHQRMYEWREAGNGGDPIAPVAKQVADETQLLCFDEFQVTNIADAMILGRLFEALFARDVFVVATSNRAPDDLYKGGLQRDRFMPFIQLFNKKLTVTKLDGDTDWRLQHLKSLETVYYTPLDDNAHAFMKTSFAELTNKATPKSCAILVQGHELTLSRTADKVAWCSFDELCDKALGAADYIALAQEFNTLLLESIPQMKRDHRDKAARFVALIDALYEHKTKLICTAEVEPEALYQTGDGSFEFGRTVSRLHEMQTDSYLGAQHEVGEVSS